MFVSMTDRRKQMSDPGTDILGFLFRELLADTIETVLSTRDTHCNSVCSEKQPVSTESKRSSTLTLLTAKDLFEFCRRFETNKTPAVFTSKYRRLFQS